MTAASVAVATACPDCAHLIGSPPETPDLPGGHMVLIHEHHIPELQDHGWILTTYEREPPLFEREPPDIVCPHYHEAHYRGDNSA